MPQCLAVWPLEHRLRFVNRLFGSHRQGVESGVFTIKCTEVSLIGQLVEVFSLDSDFTFKLEPLQFFAVEFRPYLFSFFGQLYDPTSFLNLPVLLLLLQNFRLFDTLVIINALMVIPIQPVRSPMWIVPYTLVGFVKIFCLLELLCWIGGVLFGKHWI